MRFIKLLSHFRHSDVWLALDLGDQQRQIGRKLSPGRRVPLPIRLDRAAHRMTPNKFDRSPLANAELPCRRPTRLVAVTYRHNT
ncbi:hypothetical protein PVA19_22070 [Agrobacterium sp. CNPSo 3708]|uniref:hypothetical protein n=1 Tax=Agrobacterium sp. CNPSo 3708 TaxID=3028150 RepID=UPI0023632FD6|nr:hypothetical protein [Agrobacterium sp. CNPSo 3708]MDD1501120.1 hypothetical protein [Agrobacterium sp. CNPSo 3708]